MTEMLTLEAAPGFETTLALERPPPPLEDDTLALIEDSPIPEESDAFIPKAPENKTLADLAQEVSNWTLHSDHALHAFLKRYSTDLFTRTKNLENSVRDIAAEADSAHVRLKNTFNQFLMLSNNQFMENRVYDEEQEDYFGVENTLMAVEKQETSKSEQESEQLEEQTLSTTATAEKEGRAKIAAESIVAKYKSALEMGMEAMKLFVMMDEEEEEDKCETLSQFDTVLDIYNERPLPFIIGTREFLEDETLGLGAAPEEYLDSDSSSSYTSSYSSSDSDSKSESDTSHTSLGKTRSSHLRSRYSSSSEESDGSLAAEQPPRRRANSDENDTSELFGRPPVVRSPRRRANSEESDVSGLFGRPSAPEVALPQSRGSVSRGSSRRPVFDDDKEESDGSDWTSDSDEGEKEMPTRKQSSRIRRSHGIEPPPFAAPRDARKNQFFDSSDEESDAGLFGSALTTKPKVFATDESEESKQRMSLSAVQSSTSDDLVGGSTSTSKQRDTSDRLNTRRSDSFGSSSSDEERGLFGDTVEKKTPIAQAQQQGFRLPPMGETASRRTNEFESKRSYLSSDSDAESTTSGLFGRPSSAVKDTRKYPAGVSELPAPQQSRRLASSDDSSDNDDDGGLFGATRTKQVTPRVQPVVAPPTTVISAPRHSTHAYSSSDSDEDDGELFGAIPKFSPGTTIAPPVSAPDLPVQRVSQSDLFGEGDSDDSDDSDDGGLFGTNKAIATKDPPVLATRLPPVVTRDVIDSDSDNDGELFGFPQSSKSNATAPITIAPTGARQSRVHSDSSSSDEGLFGAPLLRTAPTPTPTPVPIPASTSAVTSSVPPANPLIHQQDSSDGDSDDWSDNDGGLFGAATSKPTPVKLAAAPVPAVRSAPDPAPTQAAVPLGSPADTLAPIVHPPLSSAAARLRATESYSDSDSDSDWDDGGLFGPSKK